MLVLTGQNLVAIIGYIKTYSLTAEVAAGSSIILKTIRLISR